jgi:capsular exopolysaccharide synthesis family protein
MLPAASVGNLQIMPSGPVPPNPSELISSNRMKELLALLREKFDFIIWDSPPLFMVAESLVLSKLLDGTVLVAKAGSTTYEDLNRGIKSIKDIESRILGVVINGIELKETGRYYNRYFGHYYASSKDAPPPQQP